MLQYYGWHQVRFLTEDSGLFEDVGIVDHHSYNNRMLNYGVLNHSFTALVGGSIMLVYSSMVTSLKHYLHYHSNSLRVRSAVNCFETLGSLWYLNHRNIIVQL